MNSREKFLATMNFDRQTRPPLYEIGYWVWTIKRWYKEGLPLVEGLPQINSLVGGDVGSVSLADDVWFLFAPDDGLTPNDLDRVINFDKRIIGIPGNWWIFPEYEPRILEEEDDCLIVSDRWGTKQRVRKRQDSTTQYLDWPVKNREDWEKFKEERLNSKTPGRYPPNLNGIFQGLEKRDYPINIGCNGPISPGFYGPLRYILGEEKLLTIYYDDPGLVKDIINYLVDFWIQLWTPILKKITPDCVSMWEDMCYKTGPLVSPDIFKEFMLPAYKKFTYFLKSHGVDHIILDTDGNVWKLIPLFLEGGITGLQPMEVAAGMDVIEVRKSFPHLQILGGIDKREIAKGKEAIDKELNTKIPYMVDRGGYIPFIDHSVPPDISFENFRYYRKKIEELTQNDSL